MLCSQETDFEGKYYASFFIHYMPADKSIWDFSLEVIT
jgi:hypothetical protein